MWKDYSSGYIKNNRSFGISMMAAAFIASLLLSLLGGMFYNVWKYEIERIEREEGSWQSRITGITDGNGIESIKNFASVNKAVVSRETGEEETSVDIYFDHMGSVFADTPRIAKLAGAAPEQVVYNYELLAMYLIRSPSDPAPRMLFPLFLNYNGSGSLFTGCCNTQLFRGIHECKNPPVWYFVRYRGYAKADPDMPAAGSGGSVYDTGDRWKPAGHCRKYGTFTDHQCSRK